ncbi:MAG: DUF374 domain-containing protein [Rickettsiales bacterium]|nr:DUF374 domain-containing protein [Rickettsiales bacterium]
MKRKWKIFGCQTNVEWFDIKTKFKQLLRKIAYTWLFREIICSILSGYMWLVYLSSRKKFINYDRLVDVSRKGKPLIIVFWHNRLMMIPFITRVSRKINPDYKLMTLASNHGDGRFVGRVMEKFGLYSILGSTNDGRKSSRGISVSSLRDLIKGLKKGRALGITPDGPRGPNQKINGDVINIAKISGAGILTCSYSASKMKELDSWDKFKIPLPFSTLCFYFDDTIVFVGKKSSDGENMKLKEDLEQKMNFVQDKSLELCQKP